MAALTHVRMWTKNGWKPTTAEEAAKLHPGGTVSAHSGLFMCDLCKQYVILTDGKVKVRYFKHSSSEQEKNCPERLFANGKAVPLDPEKRDLPVRIVLVSPTAFRLEIGLVRAPITELPQDFLVEIQPKGAAYQSYVYRKEQLNPDRITYLSVGEQPYERYAIQFPPGEDQYAKQLRLRAFWPAETAGIDPQGTLFEVESGRKIPMGADTEVGKEYYLLIRGYPSVTFPGVESRTILQKQIQGVRWSLYVVSASQMSDDAARFFLRYHCCLTNRPVTLQPVWPLYVEGNYQVRHNEDCTYVLVRGDNTALEVFPKETVEEQQFTEPAPGSAPAPGPNPDPAPELDTDQDTGMDSAPDSVKVTLYRIPLTAERQQLITAGRAQVLLYTYFWKEPLEQEGTVPGVLVTDISGAEIVSGELDTIPPRKTLRVKTEFDGELILTRNHHHHIVERRPLQADCTAEVDGLTYGMGIQVAVGLDVIWQAEFVRQRQQQSWSDMEEAQLLRQLSRSSGALIPTPHSLRTILAGMSQYPQICSWIRNCIHSGSIPEQSYRLLQAVYRRMRKNI